MGTTTNCEKQSKDVWFGVCNIQNVYCHEARRLRDRTGWNPEKSARALNLGSIHKQMVLRAWGMSDATQRKRVDRKRKELRRCHRAFQRFKAEQRSLRKK